MDDHGRIESAAFPEPVPRPRPRFRAFRIVARFVLLALAAQAGLWLWVGRGALVHRVPEMTAADLDYLHRIGSRLDVLDDGGLPSRRFLLDHALGAALRERELVALRDTLAGYNAEVHVDSPSWGAFRDPHGCRDCIAVGYSERWTWPFVTHATTGYTMHPATALGWEREASWPVLRRRHRYVFVLGVWVKFGEGRSVGEERAASEESVPV